MIDFILTTILFTLPEAILLTLGVVYLLRIKCSSSERWFALGYTLGFLTLCNLIPSFFMIHIPIIIIGLSIIFKAWCNYYIPIWRYMVVVFGILLGMLVCELVLAMPLIYLLGLEAVDFTNNLMLGALLCLPTRMIEFLVLYMFNRRYYNA